MMTMAIIDLHDEIGEGSGVYLDILAERYRR
jgi:hypothetical protein